MKALLWRRRFGPLFVLGLLGALNDNLLKAAIIVYAVMTVPAGQAAITGLAASAMLTLPFALFSGWAGILADRYEKAALIRGTKAFELTISLAACAVFVSASLPLMLGIVFLMGTQSALFGPAKYGWLPERLDEHELVQANAWFEAGTFVAILAGTLLGGVMIGLGGLLPAGFLSVGVAVAGFGLSFALPKGRAAAPDLPLSGNPVGVTLGLLRALAGDRRLLRAAFLLVWFWATGAVYLSSLPALLRARLGLGEIAITLSMALFAAGIGIGSILAFRLLRGSVALWPIAPAALVVTVAGFVLSAALGALPQGGGLEAIVATPAGWAMSSALVAIAIGGGLYAVPVMSTIQHFAPPAARARTVAASNVITAVGVALVSGLVAGIVALGTSLEAVFFGTACVSLIMVALSIRAFPREGLQGLVRLALTGWFRVEVEGARHLATEGPVVYVSNHVSLLDGPLLFALIPRDCAFAIDAGWTEKPVLRRLRRLIPLTPLNPAEPVTMKEVAARIRGGGAAAIFPEGRLTVHGALMRVYPGTAWLIDMVDAPVVPISIDGLEFSIWSRPKTGFPRRLFPKVRVRVGPPRRLGLDPAIKGAERREAAVRALRDLMELHRFEALAQDPSLPAALAATARRFGRRRIVLEDARETRLSLGRLQTGAAALGAQLRARTAPGEHVGVLLPTVAAAPLVLLALWREGRIPAILNPTLGPAPALSCLGTARIDRVLCSRAFVDVAKLEPVIAHFEQNGMEIVWIEDLRAAIGPLQKARALLAGRRPGPARLSPETPAVVLFTSGTEGAPKAVVLSHGNLLANIAQLRVRSDIGPADTIFSALPVFHSLGLTGGVLLPLICGARAALYPSPLHYREIPYMAYMHQPTIILGTDTFLSGWGRKADPYDFSTLRVAISGAEPVRQSTRDLWSERFGVRILEGYGTTEAGPVLALNTPASHKKGTVGRLLPGIEMRLEDLPGLPGRQLWIRGPNIMKGYYRPEAPGVLEPPKAGWHNTGDLVDVDREGFLKIRGREKRFVKVGGEMVSLASVEAFAGQVWPGAALAAIGQPDPRKGERVVLAVTEAGRDRADLVAHARETGIGEIMIPAKVISVEAIPVLASGKTNYPELAKLLDREATDEADAAAEALAGAK